MKLNETGLWIGHACTLCRLAESQQALTRPKAASRKQPAKFLRMVTRPKPCDLNTTINQCNNLHSIIVKISCVQSDEGRCQGSSQGHVSQGVTMPLTTYNCSKSRIVYHASNFHDHVQQRLTTDVTSCMMISVQVLQNLREQRSTQNSLRMSALSTLVPT